MTQTFMVFFLSERCDLTSAIEKLRASKFTVTRTGDSLRVERGGLSFDVVRAAEPHVREEAREIGEGTPHAEAMNACDARFEVGIGDFDQAIDEINTLMSLQGALQDMSLGYLFLSWNGTLQEPWTG